MFLLRGNLTYFLFWKKRTLKDFAVYVTKNSNQQYKILRSSISTGALYRETYESYKI